MRLIRPLVVFVALAAVLIVYYAIHKPFDLAFIQNVAGAGIDLLPVSLLAICGGSFGRWLLARFKLTDLSRAERVALDALFGLGLIALASLGIGLLGGFRAILLWPVLLMVGVVSLVATGASWPRDAWVLFRRALHPVGTWSRLLALFVWIMLGLGLLMALLPPAPWDALAYHLSGPAHYLATGQITTQENPYLGFPENIEMLYGLALSLFGRDTAAAPIHWLFGALALMATMGLLRRTASSNGESMAWLSAAILLSSFSIWQLFGWPYVDLAVMAYGAALLVSLYNWQQDQRLIWLAMGGLFIGLALGAKLTSGGLLVAAFSYLLLFAWNQAKGKPGRWLSLTVRYGGWIGLFAVLAFLPWMVKGLLLYHNPVYPYLFGGDHWSAARAIRFNQFNVIGDGMLQSDTAALWPTLPLSATLFGDHGALFDFTTGPWLFTLPLLLLLAWPSLRRDSDERRLARLTVNCVVAVLILWWIASAFTNISTQTRFMAMIMPGLAILGALGVQAVHRWPIKPINIYFLLQSVLALTLALAVIDAARWVVELQGVNYLAGLANRQAVLDVAAPNYLDAMSQLAKLPDHTAVRVLWEPRDYGCPTTIDCQIDYALDGWQAAIEAGRQPDQVFADWKQDGDRYIMVANNVYQFYTGPTVRAAAIDSQFGATLLRWLTPIWSNDGYTLYRWITPDYF